jgi:hypothetical protein
MGHGLRYRKGMSERTLQRKIKSLGSSWHERQKQILLDFNY